MDFFAPFRDNVFGRIRLEDVDISFFFLPYYHLLSKYKNNSQQEREFRLRCLQEDDKIFRERAVLITAAGLFLEPCTDHGGRVRWRGLCKP